MTRGEAELEREVRHLAEHEKRVARQEALVARLQKVGLPTDDAVRLLGSMQDLLRTMRDHIAKLSK
jgi:hypothetical protein